MSHRGPDNLTVFEKNQVMLGHTRLAIIDKSATANQPYFFEDLILVYNGEIFNYLEIRDSLKLNGYHFETESDTEVVIKALHFYKEEAFLHFNGMWALALFNSSTNELLISRDRFGQKPLFYSRTEFGWIFSSEIQAIVEIKKPTPNFAAIQSFLREADFNVRDNTFFEGVFEFPCANYVTFSGEQVKEQKKYWEYPKELTKGNISFKDIYDLLEDAIRIRLRTDVEYSLLLSGGIDSTIVAGSVKKIVGENVNLSAFCYSSRDEFDEATYASKIAESLSINLSFGIQEKDPNLYIKRLSRLVRNLGRGHGSPAIVSVDYLYEKIKLQGFKVTLDGQGADELLAGYPHYHIPLLFDNLSSRDWKQARETLRDLVKEGFFKVFILYFRVKSPSFFRYLMRAFFGYERMFNQFKRFRLQSAPLYKKETPTTNCNQSYLNKYLTKQHKTGLKNLLYYGDIVAMANSVENRSPFLDHRLINLLFSLDYNYKVVGGKSKFVLRKHPIYMQYKFLLERRKIGFASNISTDIKCVMLSELKRSEILNWPTFNLLNLKEFLSNPETKENHKFEPLLFRLFQVHLWSKEFIRH
jgi:asparagine synthase (glutamine-hydrolysing)